METISWVGPGAKKLVGESHRRNHMKTSGVAAEPGTSSGFLPLCSAPLPAAVWLTMINGKVSASEYLRTRFVPLHSCFWS